MRTRGKKSARFAFFMKVNKNYRQLTLVKLTKPKDQKCDEPDNIIWLSDWSASIKFMEEILSLKLMCQVQYLLTLNNFIVGC